MCCVLGALTEVKLVEVRLIDYVRILGSALLDQGSDEPTAASTKIRSAVELQVPSCLWEAQDFER